MSGPPTWGAAREAWGFPNQGAQRSGAGQLNGQLAARSAELRSAER
jgi:hypothetical protein